MLFKIQDIAIQNSRYMYCIAIQNSRFAIQNSKYCFSKFKILLFKIKNTCIAIQNSRYCYSRYMYCYSKLKMLLFKIQDLLHLLSYLLSLSRLGDGGLLKIILRCVVLSIVFDKGNFGQPYVQCGRKLTFTFVQYAFKMTFPCLVLAQILAGN